MVYDSAMEYPQAKIDIFQGATYENPLVIYLTTMDTADIRLYDSTCHNQLSWNSKLVKISHVDQHRIFYQINRKQANDFEVLSWNEFVASQVAQWASVKLEKNYSFECPKKKHPLLKVYLSFALAHPRVQVKVKNKTTVQPIAIASPYQQTPTITATATATSGPSKPKSLPKKKKENANLIPMSNANRFATVSKNTTAITDAAPFTEMTNNNVKGKGKAKAQNSSSSIPCSISTTPGSVGFDLMDIEVENSAAARPTTTTTMASQSYSIPSKSVHPDRLALPESSTTLSVVPSKRTSDLDLNDDSYGTSGKRARDSAVDATSKVKCC
jgi:hypothetical protein